jgi:urease accessory protein UreH
LSSILSSEMILMEMSGGLTGGSRLDSNLAMLA